MIPRLSEMPTKEESNITGPRRIRGSIVVAKDVLADSVE